MTLKRIFVDPDLGDQQWMLEENRWYLNLPPGAREPEVLPELRCARCRYRISQEPVSGEWFHSDEEGNLVEPCEAWRIYNLRVRL